MRVVRRLVHVLVIVLTLIVGATAAAVIVSQTAWFKNWLRGYIVREANQYLNGELSIKRLGGNLFFGVELEDVGISLDGSRVVAVEDLGLNYNVFEMISKGMSVDEIRLNKPVLYLRRDGATWSISKLVKKQEQEADREGPAYPISIDEIGISDASIVVDDPVGTSGVDVPRRFDRVDAALSFKYEPVRYSIDITHVSFRGSDPAIGLNALSGGVSVRNDTLYVDKLALRTEESSIAIDGAVQHYLGTPVLNLRVSSDRTSLPELARVVPALSGIALQPAYEIELSGPLDRLDVTMKVRSSAGQVRGQFVADAMTPGQSVRGDVSVRHLNIAPLVKNPAQTSDITADAHVDLTAGSFADIDSLRGRLAVTSPRVRVAGYEAERIRARATLNGRRVTLDARAAAYGTDATVSGRVRIPNRGEPLAYDVHGRAQHLDLRRLPATLQVPPAATDISASYHARGSEPAGGTRTPRTVDADLQFERSTMPGAEIEAGSTASVSVRGNDLAYQADATLAGVDLQQIGTAFNVPALATDRFKSVINGQVTASGSGTTAASIRLTAAGTLTDSRVLGGEVPSLAFNGSYGDDAVQLKATGSFSGFDPADLSGKAEMKGSVSGMLDVDASLANVSKGVSVDSVEAAGHVDLTDSTIGGLAIDRASVDGDYRARGGEIRQLEVSGRDLNVKASGPIALGSTGSSNLTVHADTPSLETLGQLFDVEVSGIAKVDATITGNGDELQAKGKVIGNNLVYGGSSVLAISSDYSAQVPNLEFKRATVDADTQATFLSVGGQNLNEVTAKTTYRESEIVFEADAKQPERALTAAGTLLLHPEHQEVHLERITLDTRGQQWQLAPDAQATIEYGGGATTLENVRLVSGDQSIDASGTFGRPGDALHVTVNNVELANVDALLLREPQFTGRLNATATVTGSPDALRGEAEFAVAKGGFRQFRYDAFSGTAAYSGRGLTIDTRLQQNPTQWLTAKGYVPVTVFAKRPEDAEPDAPHVHQPPADPEDRIDLAIDSSPIDVGIVQGFTTALTDVTGTMEAHLRVEGSGDDPHPTGAITVIKGTATVAALGVKYEQIDGRLDLQPDRVHIEQLTVLDNHKSPLRVTGDLAIHERELGAVQIRVIADDFKVIDNKMGNVRVRSDLALTGELRSPRVEGTIAVTTGDIKLDEIVAQAGTSPYATTPVELATPAETQTEDEKPATPFDALSMNVRVTVPDDLVVKASSLQAPGSSVGLGALNVTLGGDLSATKQPGGRVQLVGTVNTIRGNYDFQGRRFEILRDGTIRFEGLEELNPRIDLRTRRLIQGVEARVNVNGTLREPNVVLSSTPPLDEADILSLIVFNQPINQLGEGQQLSLAARAQSLAAGAVAGQLAQSIGNALDLDTFELNLAPESGRGPELTVGQQVGQNLYVKVQQALADMGTINVIFEYELNKWLRLQTNILQGAPAQQSMFRRADSSGADLLFFFSY